MLTRVEHSKHAALHLQQIGQRRIRQQPSTIFQLNHHATPVRRIRSTANQSTPGQAVDPIRHRPTGHHRLGDQLTGGEPIRRTRSTQGSKDVELPGLQLVPGERRGSGPVQVPGQPGDPRKDLQGGDVEIRSLPPPGQNDPVDLIHPSGQVLP